jgi:hypothetical protein
MVWSYQYNDKNACLKRATDSLPIVENLRKQSDVDFWRCQLLNLQSFACDIFCGQTPAGMTLVMAYLWLEEAYTVAWLYSSFSCYSTSKNKECLPTEIIEETMNSDTLHTPTHTHSTSLIILKMATAVYIEALKQLRRRAPLKHQSLGVKNNVHWKKVTKILTSYYKNNNDNGMKPLSQVKKCHVIIQTSFGQPKRLM